MFGVDPEQRPSLKAAHNRDPARFVLNAPCLVLFVVGACVSAGIAIAAVALLEDDPAMGASPLT